MRKKYFIMRCIQNIFIFLLLLMVCATVADQSTTTEEDDTIRSPWRWQSPLSYVKRRSFFPEYRGGLYDQKVDFKSQENEEENNYNNNNNNNQDFDNIMPNFNVIDYNKQSPPAFHEFTIEVTQIISVGSCVAERSAKVYGRDLHRY
uniref:Uncharacterized protein n=1 Tax=Glossina palpalis gambiensis TaxID=67801 RepID=A0A1B0AKE8_9MUSC